MAYAYTENEDTLWFHLYIGSTLTKRVGEKHLELTVTTDFPWEGSGEITIHAAEPVECTLAFRIPGWCQEGRIFYENGEDRDLVMGGHGAVGTLFMGKGKERDVAPEEYERYVRLMEERFGKPIARELLKKRKEQEGHTADDAARVAEQNMVILQNLQRGIRGKVPEDMNQAHTKQGNMKNIPVHVGTHLIEGGYIYIRRQWQEGDRLVFDFPMEVMAVEADPKVRETIGKVAFTRGPIVYCMEEADNGDNLHLCQVEEQVLRSGKGIEVVENHALGHRLNVLEVPGVRTLDKDEGASLYRKVSEPLEKKVTLRLVPYYAWNNRGEGEMSVWIRKKT
jgi:DUF1680 family protein